MKKTAAGSRRTKGSTGGGPPAVLVTGFAPFGGEAINSSWQTARALDGVRIGAGRAAAVVVARQLPCEFDAARAVLERLVRRLDPQLVVALGQTNRRSDVSIERVAINVNDARIADNAGAKPIDTPVIEGAPVGYFSSLPIKSIVQAIRKAGIPASVSQTAGTYVCNHLFFGLMHLLATRYADKRGGFIHLPPLPQQAALLPDTASLALPTMAEAVRIAIVTSLAAGKDIRVSEGAID